MTALHLGNPHVGGNTWAGGSGGADTAGLGGIGGPYRLDLGHDVYQVPQEMKDNVPPHVLKVISLPGCEIPLWQLLKIMFYLKVCADQGSDIANLIAKPLIS